MPISQPTTVPIRAVKHRNSVERVIFGPGDLVATLAKGEIKIWNAQTQAAVGNISLPEEIFSFETVRQTPPLAFSPDGKHLAVILYRSAIALFDTHGEQTFQQGRHMMTAKSKTPDYSRFEIPDSTGMISAYMTTSVAFSADGKRLISSGSFAERPRVWDVQTRKLLRSIEDKRSSDATRVVVSPDSRSFAVVFRSGEVRLVDSFTGAKGVLLRNAGNPFSSTQSFAQNGKNFVCIDSDGVAKTFDCRTGRLLAAFQPFQKDGEGRYWCFLDGGRKLATIYHGSDAKNNSFQVLDVWDVAARRRAQKFIFPNRGHSFVGGERSPSNWDISSDMAWLVTGGRFSRENYPQRAFVWNLKKRVLSQSLPRDSRLSPDSNLFFRLEGRQLF